MAIVFGSPEATDLLRKDKERQKIEAQLAEVGWTVSDLWDRIDDINHEIYMLEAERSELMDKYNKAKRLGVVAD